ncbi:MAG: hypothetical protein U1A78_32690 [Polyangia bacterium]
MRRRSHRAAARAAGVALGCVAAVLALAQCFAPTYSDCAFRCGPQAPLCPDEYECRSDGYCHLRESTASCPYTLDLSPPPDLGAGPLDR